MIKLPEKARDFLEKNVPEALEKKDYKELLLELNYWILANGFTDDFDEYNAIGEEAQAIYDLIYHENT